MSADLHTEYPELERLIAAAAQVPDQAAVNGEWGARDVLAHVLAWQEYSIRRLGGADPEVHTEAELDAWNAAAHERYRDLALSEIVARLRDTRRTISALTERGEPKWLGGCTEGHYEEHLGDLERAALSR